MNEQPQVPIYDAKESSEEGKRFVTIVADLESKQLEFLDTSSKSIIERIATFLTILFAVTAFGNNFPPAYLKGNISAKWLVIVTLILLLAALGAGIWTIQPHRYKYYEYNSTGMREEFNKIISRKMCWLRWAGVLFALGLVTLAALVVSIIWTV